MNKKSLLFFVLFILLLSFVLAAQPYKITAAQLDKMYSSPGIEATGQAMLDSKGFVTQSADVSAVRNALNSLGIRRTVTMQNVAQYRQFLNAVANVEEIVDFRSSTGEPLAKTLRVTMKPRANVQQVVQVITGKGTTSVPGSNKVVIDARTRITNTFNPQNTVTSTGGTATATSSGGTGAGGTGGTGTGGTGTGTGDGGTGTGTGGTGTGTGTSGTGTGTGAGTVVPQPVVINVGGSFAISAGSPISIGGQTISVGDIINFGGIKTTIQAGDVFNYVAGDRFVIIRNNVVIKTVVTNNFQITPNPNPTPQQPTYKPPSKMSLFKGAVIFGAIAGLTDYYVESSSVNRDKIDRASIAGSALGVGVINTGVAFGVALVITKTISAIATKAPSFGTFATKWLTPVGWAVLIGTVIGSSVMNVGDSKVWGMTSSFDNVSTRKVIVKSSPLLKSDVFSGVRSVGVSNKNYRLVVNIDEIDKSRFFVGLSGKQMEIDRSNSENGLVEVDDQRKWVPGEYIVYDQGILSNAVSKLELYINLEKNRTGFDKGVRGLFRRISGEAATATGDIQMNVATKLVELLKGNSVIGAQYIVYSSDEDGNLTKESDGLCIKDNSQMLITCNLVGSQLNEEGIYLYEIRVKFNELELLNKINSSSETGLEKTIVDDYCGFYPLEDVDKEISELTCKMNVMDIYDTQLNQYTDEGKQKLSELKKRVDDEIDIFKNKIPSSGTKFFTNVLNSMSVSNFDALSNKLDVQNVNLKNSNAAVLKGYPIFGVFIVGSPSKEGSISDALGEDWVIEEEGPLLAGQSVSYYIKALNKKIVSGPKLVKAVQKE